MNNMHTIDTAMHQIQKFESRLSANHEAHPATPAFPLV